MAADRSIWRTSSRSPTAAPSSPPGSARTPGPLPRVPATGAGAVDGEHGRAAPVSGPPGARARRVHGAAAGAAGVAGTPRRPRERLGRARQALSARDQPVARLRQGLRPHLEGRQAPHFRVYDFRHTYAACCSRLAHPCSTSASRLVTRSRPRRSGATRNGSRVGTDVGWISLAGSWPSLRLKWNQKLDQGVGGASPDREAQARPARRPRMQEGRGVQHPSPRMVSREGIEPSTY